MEYKLDSNEINLEKIKDYQEFYLLKGNAVYKIITGIIKNGILFISKYYIKLLKLNEISVLLGEKYNSIYSAYEYIKYLFEDNKILIKHITINKQMKLIIISEGEKENDIILNYNKSLVENNNIIIKEINQIKNEINNIKKSEKKINDFYDNFKKNQKKEEPKDIKIFSNIVDDSYSWVNLENTFTVFKSINDISYLIYTTENRSLICYDISNMKIINKLISIHNEHITNIKHYLDSINKRDLVMSISRNENRVKIWDVNNWAMLVDIKNINNVGFIYSACIIKDNNNNFIITSNRNMDGNPEAIKIFNFQGQKIKEVDDSYDHTFYIDTYFDNILLKNYIITGNFGYVKSYDYSKNKLYYKYDDNQCTTNKKFHCSVIIKNFKNVIKMIESGGDGFIRIWNFHTKKLLNKINIGISLYSICLWNDDYLFVGCEDNTIKLIELNNELVVKCLEGHDNWVLSLKKIYIPKLGECLISQNWGTSKIKIWRIKK